MLIWYEEKGEEKESGIVYLEKANDYMLFSSGF